MNYAKGLKDFNVEEAWNYFVKVAVIVWNLHLKQGGNTHVEGLQANLEEQTRKMIRRKQKAYREKNMGRKTTSWRSES